MNTKAVGQRKTCDVSGFAIFSEGGMGAAHVMAHRMLDQGRIELGRAQLGAWLEKHGAKVEGSDGVHLHFHMLVFETALGDVRAARSRFEKHILPYAARSDIALTDAPQSLWRLEVAGARNLSGAWAVVRDRALGHVGGSSAYEELHHLMALAGAKDTASLDRWLAARRGRTTVLDQMAGGLRALAASDFDRAARALEEVIPFVSEIGGSRAQNELFTDMFEMAARRSPMLAA